MTMESAERSTVSTEAPSTVDRSTKNASLSIFDRSFINLANCRFGCGVISTSC
jgi:hypothetical protein